MNARVSAAALALLVLVNNRPCAARLSGSLNNVFTSIGRVRPRAIEQIRQQHEIAGGRESLAHLEQHRTNAGPVHIEDDAGPRVGCVTVGTEQRRRADAVGCTNLDRGTTHGDFLSQYCVVFAAAPPTG